MTEQWRCPQNTAKLPSDHRPLDAPGPYPTGARVGLVREHAALGCQACQEALSALDEYLADRSDELTRIVAERHARTREHDKVGLGASRSGRDSSILAFATDGGDRDD